MRSPLIQLLVLGACLACLGAVDSVTAKPVQTIVYKEVDGKALNLEIYLPAQSPAGSTPGPGVILFHGGGWKSGSLEQFRHACQYFASRGLVAATVDYRMQGKGQPLPAGLSRKELCITDARSAIRWMKQHAAELGFDPKRLIAGGGSAGGHIALLATSPTGPDDPQDPPGIDTSVVAYVLFNPALEAKDPPAVDALRTIVAPYPPVVVFFGTEDSSWKPGGDALVARLRALGGNAVTYWLAPGQAHSFFNKTPWLDLTLAAADRFLVQQGLLTGESTLAPPKGGEQLVAAP